MDFVYLSRWTQWGFWSEVSRVSGSNKEEGGGKSFASSKTERGRERQSKSVTTSDSCLQLADPRPGALMTAPVLAPSALTEGWDQGDEPSCS